GGGCRIVDVGDPTLPRITGGGGAAPESGGPAPRGRYLFQAGGDGAVAVWDVADPRAAPLYHTFTARLSGGGAAHHVAADDDFLYVAHDDGLLIYAGG